MFLRELFEADETTVGLIFGRFNPPHIGHANAWKKCSENSIWYVGTNPKTIGKKDPLPLDIKTQAMTTIMPEVAQHLLITQSWLTACSDIYKKHGDVTLKIYTDESYVIKLINDYNGVDTSDNPNGHGVYKFSKIIPVQTDRVEINFVDKSGTQQKVAAGATNLRNAAIENDEAKFNAVSGIDPNLKFNGKSYFNLVQDYLSKYFTINTSNSDNATDAKEGVEGTNEMAAYKGNIGIMELMKFFADAGKNDPELVAYVKKLINDKKDAEVWRIVQDYTGTELVGKEFHESIHDMIISAAKK